jgi:hypothetical protein
MKQNKTTLIKKIFCENHNVNENNVKVIGDPFKHDGNIESRIVIDKIGEIPSLFCFILTIDDLIDYCIKHTNALNNQDTTKKYCKVCGYPMIKLSSKNIAYCGKCQKEYSWKLEENELPLICCSRAKTPKG